MSDHLVMLRCVCNPVLCICSSVQLVRVPCSQLADVADAATCLPVACRAWQSLQATSRATSFVVIYQ